MGICGDFTDSGFYFIFIEEPVPGLSDGFFIPTRPKTLNDATEMRLTNRASLYFFLLKLVNPMKHIWSPWRMKYIEQHEKEEGCVFCNVLAKKDDAKNLIAFRGEHAFVILNRYPYTSGHLMVIPFAHAAILEELGPSARGEMMELTSQCISVLTKTYHPQGFNMGANIGEAAGAGVPGHIHIHIVPRWGGDTNFMSALGDTRVLPEALEDTFNRVCAGFREIR